MSAHKFAPWKRMILVPLWVFQFGLIIANIALIGLSMQSVRKTEKATVGSSQNFIVSDSAWLILTILCLISSVVEVYLFLTLKLTPLVFVLSNVVKSGIWLLLLTLDLIVVTHKAEQTVRDGFILDALLLLSFLAPVSYGAVILNRHIKEKKFYNGLDFQLKKQNEEYRAQFNKLDGVSPKRTSTRDSIRKEKPIQIETV